MILNPPIFKGDPAYAYATGLVRGLERKLLNKSDFNRLLDATSDQLWNILEEFGYPPVREGDWENSLKEESDKIITLFAQLSKEEKYTEILLRRYDYLNLAMIFKRSLSQQISSEDTYFPRGTIDISQLKRVVELEDYESLPAFLREPYHNARSAFDNTGNPSVIDNILEYHYYQTLLSEIPPNQLVREFWRMKTDFFNLSLFLRLKLQKITMKPFWDFYHQGGYLDMGFYKKCAETDPEMLSPLFLNTQYGQALSEVINKVIHHRDFTPFMKFSEGLLVQKLKMVRFSPFGFEVLFAYLHLKEFEIRSLRAIIKAKLANIPKEYIKKVLAYEAI
ncbi:V-type ATPase subunit [bacterium]|nr:V-type ATPase subunit [bacterium]